MGLFWKGNAASRPPPRQNNQPSLLQTNRLGLL